MQKTLIKSILAVAVAGTFASFASAAQTELYPFTDYIDATGTPDWTKVGGNFTFLDGQIKNNKTELGKKVDTTTFTTELDKKVDKTTYNTDIGNINTELGKKVDTATFNDAKSDLQTKIDTNKGAILDNKALIANNATSIANHETRLGNAETRLDGHDTRLDNAEGRIETNKVAIQANQTAIAAHYAEMKNNFAAVNTRIDKLDDKMKKGFASQAALNGLFQPYNVGKFNVSAAIGGYDSEQAMAIGTGYRFNENFAIKAGVASDLGGFDHVTYNIGANFEF